MRTFIRIGLNQQIALAFRLHRLAVFILRFHGGLRIVHRVDRDHRNGDRARRLAVGDQRRARRGVRVEPCYATIERPVVRRTPVAHIRVRERVFPVRNPLIDVAKDERARLHVANQKGLGNAHDT